MYNKLWAFLDREKQKGNKFICNPFSTNRDKSFDLLF